MSGFDAQVVNAAFFSDTSVRVNLLVNLGHGNATRLHPRNPRLPFEDVCQVI